MNHMKRLYIPLLVILVLLLASVCSYSQCPANIGFELGSFENWECSVGTISGADGSLTLESSPPMRDRHTLIKSSNIPEYDPYGGFPTSCPNGSNYSIRLGNDGTGKQAERVSYTFTIPANQNNYSIIYNYAVVFQNPGHQNWEQPKFTANVYDVTTNAYIGCSSFEYAASSNLPGFQQSGIKDSVFFKNWTPVTIKLSGYAGRTIRLEFTTHDCSRGGHFGYAYVDVNENCSSPISGFTQCALDTSQTLTAPFGFAGYRWFNKDFSKLLGTGGNLHFNPIPPPGTVVAVEVTPFPDQGCTDTVYTTIAYSSEVLNLKTPQAPQLSCITTGLDLTSGQLISGSSPGLSFEYFTDASLSNYVSIPKMITKSGTYYIRATNDAGCTSIKAVTINISDYPSFKINNPPNTIRPQSLDLSTVISGNTAGVVFTYWLDEKATIPLANPETVKYSGTYYIKGTNEGGCYQITKVTVVVAEPPITAPNAFSPNGDGIHDVWEIPILSLYADCTVEIFNRLGQSIFRSTGYHKPWDGKFNGIDQPVGTYYYVIRPRSDLPAVGGSVTLIR
ncbi:MAG: gliding motility-associated C-terminal domain-containing protein [Bacteroidota bacterium]